MSEDILHALRATLALGLATDLTVNKMAEEIVDTLGIPASTLASLRAGTHVVVERRDIAAGMDALALSGRFDESARLCAALAAAPEAARDGR